MSKKEEVLVLSGCRFLSLRFTEMTLSIAFLPAGGGRKPCLPSLPTRHCLKAPLRLAVVPGNCLLETCFGGSSRSLKFNMFHGVNKLKAKGWQSGTQEQSLWPTKGHLALGLLFHVRPFFWSAAKVASNGSGACAPLLWASPCLPVRTSDA